MAWPGTAIPSPSGASSLGGETNYEIAVSTPRLLR